MRARSAQPSVPHATPHVFHSEIVLCKASPVCDLDAPDHLPPSTLRVVFFFRARPIAVFGQDAKEEGRS
eukprot:15474690-Alexandrium_andersonii.AAC.1